MYVMGSEVVVWLSSVMSFVEDKNVDNKTFHDGSLLVLVCVYK